MLRFALTTVVALLASPALAAGFSGTIEMKIQSDAGGGGTVRMLVGDGGMLSIADMGAPGGGTGGMRMQMKSLVRKDKPGVVVLIDDANKTWREIDVNGMAKAEPGGETWTVKKLGSEKIAGYASEHVQVTSSRGTQMEMWTTRELFDGNDSFAAAMREQQKIPGSLAQALAQAKADGFVTKMVSKAEGGAMTMEVVQVTKSTHPASTFQIPSGYSKASMPAMPAGMQLPPDAQKQLEESMKSLTPEQREQMKKMMGR